MVALDQISLRPKVVHSTWEAGAVATLKHEKTIQKDVKITEILVNFEDSFLHCPPENVDLRIAMITEFHLVSALSTQYNRLYITTSLPTLSVLAFCFTQLHITR